MRIEGERRTWETPMANDVIHVAVALREAMEELGWRFSREETERLYSRFSVLLPWPKVAYVFRFRVLEPLEDVTFDTWEMRLTHRGDISFLKVDDYLYEDVGLVQRLLRELVERLPRRPWDFPLGQRLEAGLVIPEWGQAKRMWQRMAFDVGERTPKGWVPRGTIGDRMRGGPELDDGTVEEGSEARVEELVPSGDEEDQG
jgi:8-oxo-dGTP pyrophosphatase MutT (NUDIX family)